MKSYVYNEEKWSYVYNEEKWSYEFLCIKKEIKT